VISLPTAPLQRVYLPLILGGGASVNSARTTTIATYNAFGSDWRASGNPRTFICTQDL
jgi:hypothetical protein